MRITESDTLGELEREYLGIVRKSLPDERKVVREGIKVGQSLSRGFAKKSAGAHGKHYHKSITSEMHGAQSGLRGGTVVSGEWGPDPTMPQGGMSFERGSRNQPAHLDLLRAADIVGPAFYGEVGRMVGGWFD